MKRFRVVGLCAVIACAAGAVTGGPSASAAEFGRCVPLKKGNYTEGNCKTVAEKRGVPDHKGRFEFEPVNSCYATKHGNFTEAECKTVAEKRGNPDHKGGYEASPVVTFATNGGTSEWDSASGTWKCTASNGSGEITSATSLTEKVVFSGCEMKGIKCQNTAYEGEIETFPLHGELIEPSAGHAQLVLTGTFEGKYFTEYGCTGIAAVRVSGSLGGEQSPLNVTSHTNTLLFHEGAEQSLISEFGPPGWSPSETLSLPSEIRTELTNKTTDEMEIHLK